MARGPQSLRGDVNAILNGLIREGVITGFETNFDNPASIALALHVRVTVNRLAKEIEALEPGVIVSVRSTPGFPL